MVKEHTKFDFDDGLLDEILRDSSSLDDIFFLKDLQHRKMFFNSDISDDSVFAVVRAILQFNTEDKNIPVESRRPILLYFNSNGGDVAAGLELISAIKLSKTPVYTINLGYWYSMGFLVGLTGHKRYAMPNSTFLLHDGASGVYNSSSKARDQMDFYENLDRKMRDIVLKYTKITESEYAEHERNEWYMFSEEAKERGVIDYIVGEDCDIDEII